MIPKKPKELYKQFAEEEDLDKEFVEDLMSYYYKKVKGLLVDMKHTRINIDGLGQFVIKPITVQNLIKRNTAKIAGIDGYSLASYHNKNRLESRLADLTNIAQIIEQEKQEKEQFKANRYAKRNLEE